MQFHAVPSYKRFVYDCLPSGWWVHIRECLPRVHHKCSEHVVCAIPKIVKVELFFFVGLCSHKDLYRFLRPKPQFPHERQRNPWTDLFPTVSFDLCVFVPRAVIKSAENTASEHYHCCLDSLYLLEILRIQSLVCNLCSKLPPFWKKNRAIIYYYVWK